MLKKEIISVLKQTFYFLIMAFTAPGILIVTTIIRDGSYFQVFFPLLQFGLLFWALFMGISMFSSEQSQRGMEYLLSLPYTRLHLIGLKILPRVVVVLALYLFCWLLYANGGGNAAVLPHFSFTILYFAVFCIALSYSARSDNFLALFVLTMFSLIAYLGILSGIFWATLQAKGYIFYEFEIMPFFTEGLDSYLENLIVPVSIGILLPFLIALFFSFKKFDARPIKAYNIRFLKAFLPVLIVGLIGGFVFSRQTLDIGYTNYYLTPDLQVVESNSYSGVIIYDGQRAHRIDLDVRYYWPSWEDNGFVYFRGGNRIGRLNTREHTSEILYEAPLGRRINWRTWGYEQTMVFLERTRDYTDFQFVSIDLETRDVKKIPLTGESFGEYSNWTIFGADKVEDKLFWLMYPHGRKEDKPVYQLWEDGQINSIGTSQSLPFYINRTLFSDIENEIIASKHKEGRFEILRSIPNEEDLHFGWYGHYPRKLSNSPANEVYGRKVYRPSDDTNAGRTYHAKYARLDLDTYEIEEMPGPENYVAFYSFNTGLYYALEWDDAAQEVKLYKVEKGKLELFKTFQDVDPEHGLNDVQLSQSGILVKKGKKIKVYAWPDLKEIKFKKL
jgi:ABC-type transport system involved in multi-copper enzyme maturation permease subunit